MKNRLLTLLFFSFTSLAGPQPLPLPDNASIVDISRWHFSLALGVGERTNPLHGGDNTPLYLVPSLHYYADNFYFDNGDLGYSFIQTDQLVISVLATVNDENAYFSRWHPKNVFVSQITHALIGPVEKLDQGFNIGVQGPVNKDFVSHKPVDIADISKRKWAIDAGIQLNWFIVDNLNLTGQVLHDVNNVYHGFNANLQLAHFYRVATNEKISIKSSLGLDWSSAAMVDYYYGLDEQDKLAEASWYQGKSTFSVYAKLYTGYQLNEHWKLFLWLNYKTLGKGISDSSLVDKNHAVTGFIGAGYAF